MSANDFVLIPNIPPGEEARRRDAAIDLLSSDGINPQSLSPEQFYILANQPPEQQKESLAMFARYGAEQLRVVYPNKDGFNCSRSTPTRGHDGLPQPAVERNQSQPSTSGFLELDGSHRHLEHQMEIVSKLHEFDRATLKGITTNCKSLARPRFLEQRSLRRGLTRALMIRLNGSPRGTMRMRRLRFV
ncbi:hypothetical protein B0T25DRAFT_354884 [Lasiosphaeria hispida]|uniref:Uncharacterized protein n=1 Tax=Lasiosphaeria hispida TaxID=260671 RepID=A0AAJ0H745_9PEZI|nr:hypothetical protein B0T25DRAFT_354884 [Lasiosphaeria hispida]